MKRTISSSLCRFRVSEEHLITDDLVKAEIALAFEEGRCYDFYPDREIMHRMKLGDPVEIFRDRLIDVRNDIFNRVAGGDRNMLTILKSDARLSSRIIAAMTHIYRAINEGDFTTLPDRRFVVIKERPELPTLFHVSPESTVLAHVGQGPPWGEIPTLYLGLKIFDALTVEQKKGKGDIIEAFRLLLMVEERAIDMGYSHIEVYTPKVSRALNSLLDSVIEHASQFVTEEAVEIPVRPKPAFSDANRKAFLRDLDARMERGSVNFDYEKNLRAIKRLENAARRFKKAGDEVSLHGIMRILVAASGHDIHEIRNRANIILERLLSPKEYDAPLATRFINHISGEVHRFNFELPPDPSGYFVRIYRNSSHRGLSFQKNTDTFDIELSPAREGQGYSAEHCFKTYGHYDYVVCRKKGRGFEWITLAGCSGRINVIPDVRGEIILEIFTDIHGHTRAYWNDSSGHPGLLYNENGEVIRLGRFSDVTEHMQEIRNRYNITAIYLLGVQKRGNNREDWAPEATSPSPFSPVSLTEIEPGLGGEEEFRELVDRAHSLGIKIIVDIIPHVNRKSDLIDDSLVVRTYNTDGELVVRASTDGRYGSWNDGKLLNYRMFRIWEWLAESIETLIEKYAIDGIRFDSAHAVPIMMKKNNFPFVYDRKRTHDEMVEGTIVVNEREDDHLITTGFYDCSCRDIISVPLHYYLMLRIEKKLKEKNRKFFINIAECYWGHERYLTRTGLVPYNSSLFKVCESIIHGESDVRQIYHIYDSYFPSALPQGTRMLGILGNHDERRAMNTFGPRGLRAAAALTIFMSDIIMDYEGGAEGEGWKVFLDNIYVNWNQFEIASNRSIDDFYREWYSFHRNEIGRGYLVWTNNNMVAASVKFTASGIWLGAFNFSESNENVSIQFDNPELPIPDHVFYRLYDPLYSGFTGKSGYYRGSELKISRVNTVVSFTERVKVLRLVEIDESEYYDELLRDSLIRLSGMSEVDKIGSNFSYTEIARFCRNYSDIASFIKLKILPLFSEDDHGILELGLKRATYYLFRNGILDGSTVIDYGSRMLRDRDPAVRSIGKSLNEHNRRGPLVFLSAEADPFSKSGGLANVVYELPRELAKLGEETFVISGYYRHGDEKSYRKMLNAVKKYNLTYTGKNVRFKMLDQEYEVGVHSADVDGVTYYLLEHYEFFNGLYWGYTAEEKVRKRVAFARACAEVIMIFDLNPRYTFTNDAYIGPFNGIVKCDPYYINSPAFRYNTFIHIIHNGGWQYFDSYDRFENGFDLFSFFNLPGWRAGEFSDPVFSDRLNFMATGVRFSDRTATVSPSYARQIEYACDGMEHLLHDVIGISNAIGSDFRSKITESFEASGFVSDILPDFNEHVRQNSLLSEKLEKRYPEILKDPASVHLIEDEKRRYIVTRMRNKLFLQLQRHLRVDPDLILFTMIHRIAEQKGFQLLLETSEGLFKSLGFQAVIGGAVSSGDRRGEELAHGLYQLGGYYPDLVDVSLGYQEISIPILCSDLFLMPSMHEPGGISQLEAFAAGCLVVARATGGLRDTVSPVIINDDSIHGNGFLFSDFTTWSFYDAMGRASLFFRQNSDDIIYRARRNAEQSVYYWDRPARQYVETIYNMAEKIRVLK